MSLEASRKLLSEAIASARGAAAEPGQSAGPESAIHVDRLAAIVSTILSEAEAREADLRQQLDDLITAREDEQTANLLLRQAKDALKTKSRQLDESLARMEAASEAKSLFLANVSHEIRTPMNGILGMAELLLRTDLNERQQGFARTIVQSGRALLTIINDILDFSKIESGRIDFNVKPFGLRPCIEDICSLLSTQAAKKDLSLSATIHPAVPRVVLGDAGRIRQVLTNLLGNALKFTERGGVRLNVIMAGGQDPAMIRFEVIDTGVGIPADKIDAIFDKFNQVDNTATRKHEGTGLGLTICKLLAEKMGGAIGVTSREGEGSTFWVELPLEPSVESETTAASDVSLESSGIVMLREEAAACVRRSRRLEDLGLTLKVVERASIRRIEPSELHPLIADGDLFVLGTDWVDDGLIELVRRLRSDSAFAPVSILVLTEIGNSGDGLKLESAGADGYATVDLPDEVLRQLMAMMLTEQRQGKRSFMTRHKVAEATAIPVEPAAAPARGYRVLLVEDSIVNQQVALEFLEEMGCDTTVADNGAIAVEAFKGATFDVVLMDCQMPVMDGFKATTLIRQIEGQTGSGSTPIIALTANAFSTDRDKCLAAGMNDFLSKPFEPDELSAIVGKWANAKAV